MIDVTQNTIDTINSPVRKIEARIELYSGSILVDSFNHNGKLISFEIDRAGDEGKFFGFGVCQKINIKLIDKDRELEGERKITTANHFKVIYTIGGEEVAPHPLFYVTEVHRDENTNELSITAYDALKDIDKLTASNIDMTDLNKYVSMYMAACSRVLGLWIYDENGEMESLGLDVEANGDFYDLAIAEDTTDVNLEGTETLRSVLNALGEISHSIYYIDKNNCLHFKSLSYSNIDEVPIEKSQYIKLESGTNRKLTNIVHTTELNDNLSVTTGETGTTQYLRDNPFIDLDGEKTAFILNDILTYMGNFTINQFDMEWRGNPLVEVGDRLVLTTKDNQTVTSYLINDTLTYNGALEEKTSWNYQDNEEETESTPATIGEAIKQTYAKIDKVNKEISLVVTNTNESIAATNEELDTLKEEVKLKLDADAVNIEITKAVDNINKITTTTGFTFDEKGLTVSKSETDITTTITENGMVVKQGENDEKLVANAEGVKAEDLHATTYLIIGNNSRFEDYTNTAGVARTACFWIGGNS